jgi:GrpB-like predicted nucleotidyltransferase (UPF0157 family)
MTDYNPNETFELAEYNPEWPVLFQTESELIEAAMGEKAVEIQHIGSTSVPGLRAKPIIDILVAVDNFEPIEEYRRRLEPIGYRFQTHENDAERLFFWKGQPRTHHLHLVEFATWEHQRHLLFRDYLRNHAEIARLYEEIKRELAVAFKNNRPAYTKGKTAFIKSIMARALEEILDPSLRKFTTDGSEDDENTTFYVPQP